MQFLVWKKMAGIFSITDPVSLSQRGMQPKSFYVTSEVSCFYETESEIWADLGRFGPIWAGLGISIFYFLYLILVAFSLYVLLQR